MIKALRVPERLFALAMWAVSLVFASFLIGLGGKLVSDLPGVEQRITLDDFIDQPSMTALNVRADSAQNAERDVSAARERAQLALAAADNAYSSARESFTNWIATRSATTDPAQDPEVISRNRQLDVLQTATRDQEQALEAIDAQLLLLRQTQDQVMGQQEALRDDARTTFERALFWHELRIFGIRLALTLPLLLIAAWMIARKRRSDYWPLYRSFVLFAVFAFFVELVPYLPTYGGYVRYAVGILGSAVAGHYAIRAMRAYLAHRTAETQRTEAERRSSLQYEEALKRMDAGVCPGCERAIAGGKAGLSNYCVHCGMMLFNDCTTCHTRKNAFFQFCPACGVTADTQQELAATG